jgi:hypothetical protein
MYLLKHSSSKSDAEFNDVVWHILPWFRCNFNITVGKRYTPFLEQFINNNLQQIYQSEDSYTVRSDIPPNTIRWIKEWTNNWNRFLDDVKKRKIKPLIFPLELSRSTRDKLEDFWDDLKDTVIFILGNLKEWREEDHEAAKEAFRQKKAYRSHYIETPCDLHRDDIKRYFHNNRKNKMRQQKLPKGYLNKIAYEQRY